MCCKKKSPQRRRRAATPCSRALKATAKKRGPAPSSAVPALEYPRLAGAALSGWHPPFTEFHTVCFGSTSTRVENPGIRLAGGCGDREAVRPCAPENEAPLNLGSNVAFRGSVTREIRIWRQRAQATSQPPHNS